MISSDGNKRRGRPPKIMTGQVPMTNSPLYIVQPNGKNHTQLNNINNIVQLKLYTADIARLEELRKTNGFDIYTLDAFNATTQMPRSLEPSSRTDLDLNDLTSRTDLDSNVRVDLVNRKNLIINNGIKRTIEPLLQIFAEGWPTYSPYVCWVDCHPFDTTPVGIPYMFLNGVFHCYGNFCSYNCAMHYLCPDSEDDNHMRHTNADGLSGDDLSDKIQLLELMCHIETGLPFDCSIKKAASRLILKMFGGTKSIEEYRLNFQTHYKYHIFRSPMVPISYQMEESSDEKNYINILANTHKLERIYEKLQNKNILRKTLNTNGSKCT
jgi:hypothetical protein